MSFVEQKRPNNVHILDSSWKHVRTIEREAWFFTYGMALTHESLYLGISHNHLACVQRVSISDGSIVCQHRQEVDTWYDFDHIVIAPNGLLFAQCRQDDDHRAKLVALDAYTLDMHFEFGESLFSTHVASDLCVDDRNLYAADIASASLHIFALDGSRIRDVQLDFLPISICVASDRLYILSFGLEGDYDDAEDTQSFRTVYQSPGEMPTLYQKSEVTGNPPPWHDAHYELITMLLDGCDTLKRTFQLETGGLITGGLIRTSGSKFLIFSGTSSSQCICTIEGA
jgi:hypothetical protein